MVSHQQKTASFFIEKPKREFENVSEQSLGSNTENRNLSDDCIMIDERGICDADDDDGGGGLPSAEECMKLCETFSEFTETNKAMAMFYLQQNGWNLENALAEFYESNPGSPAPKVIPSHPILPSSAVVTALPASVSDRRLAYLTTSDRQHSHLFRLLSWNIDGLSVKSRDFRTEAVVHLIKAELFHIICLQEVVEPSMQIITRGLGNRYSFHYPSDVSQRDYFPMIGVLKEPGLVANTTSLVITEFPGSVMQRVAVSLEVVVDPKLLLPINQRVTDCRQLVRLRVWTSHLESCADFSEERMRQLSRIWSDMSACIDRAASNEPVYGIFCGDMNIRDREILNLGGIPRGLADVWEFTGSRSESRATWDLSRNSNLALDDPSFQTQPAFSKKSLVGSRFDRMYVGGRGLQPVDFELRGLERVPRHSHFPSDHWAILGCFDLA